MGCRWRSAWCGVVLALVANGCGEQEDDDDGASASPSETMPITTSASDDSSETSASDTSAGATTADATTGEPQSCLDAIDAAGAFLSAHRACELDADCSQVSAFCLPANTCGSSPIAVGYDMAEWMTISEGLNTCEQCGADPCGACAACVDGVCTLTLQCGG